MGGDLMGRRGPTPTPTEVLKRRGSRRAASRSGEPKPPSKTPRCPTWLSKEAKAVWKQLAKQLADLNVLTEIDGNALARYCSLWVRWRRATAFLEKNGETYPLLTNEGAVRCLQQYPEVAVVNKLSVLLLRLEQEYGLTPSARTRIHVAVSAPPDDGKSRFFKIVG